MATQEAEAEHYLLLKAMIKDLRFFIECSPGIESSPKLGFVQLLRKAESSFKHQPMVTPSVW